MGSGPPVYVEWAGGFSTMINGAVKVDLSGLEKYSKILSNDLRKKDNGPIRAAMKQWGARYRAFIMRRFVQMSKGGWTPLKSKRSRGSKSAALILRDTNTMFNAVSPEFTSKPGQLEKDIPYGVRVGYGGPSKHPSGGVSIADLASFHQVGAGFLPKRTIIVPPSNSVVKGMESDMNHALVKLDRMTDNG